MSKKRGTDFWRRHLDGWKQSGLTQVGYCARHGISIKTFTRWRGMELKGSPATRSSVTLVPVRLDRSPTSAAAQIYTPGGWRIELAGTSVAQLAELLRSLP